MSDVQIVLRCRAGACKCDYKRNSPYGVVICSKTQGEDGVPLDSKGGKCPYFKPFKVVVE